MEAGILNRYFQMARKTYNTSEVMGPLDASDWENSDAENDENGDLPFDLHDQTMAEPRQDPLDCEQNDTQDLLLPANDETSDRPRTSPSISTTITLEFRKSCSFCRESHGFCAFYFVY